MVLSGTYNELSIVYTDRILVVAELVSVMVPHLSEYTIVQYYP